MRYILLSLTVFLSVVFLSGCESEVEKAKRVNRELNTEISILKNENRTLKTENQKLKEQLKHIEKVYNIDVSDVNPKENKSSGGVFKQVYGL